MHMQAITYESVKAAIKKDVPSRAQYLLYQYMVMLCSEHNISTITIGNLCQMVSFQRKFRSALQICWMLHRNNNVVLTMTSIQTSRIPSLLLQYHQSLLAWLCYLFSSTAKLSLKIMVLRAEMRVSIRGLIWWRLLT